MGRKVAIARARSAPLRINTDGEIEEHYADSKKALDLLVQQYEEVWGEDIADRKIQDTVREEFDQEDYGEVPERIRPEKRELNDSGKLIRKARRLFS